MTISESTTRTYPPPSLTTSRIIGTSARTTNQFIVQGDLVAYTVSGGVVVCQLDQTCVISQRFFCANSNSSSGSNTGAIEGIRDSYGYPIDSPVVIGTDSASSSSDDLPSSPSKLKSKVRSINCLAISPNQKLLAVGEIGYSPRILIFSLASNSSTNPIVLIHEHSFGISSLVFSPDSKWLCSLGVVNDGYINIWKLNGVCLVASNRCSSIVNRVLWHENMIITLGLRLIKVWKFEHDVKSNILRGKNVILGNLINCNFIDACVLNDDEVLIINNANQLLLLKLTSDVKLYCLQGPDIEFGSIAIDYDSEKVWFGTSDYTVTSMEISKLVQIETVSSSPTRRVNLLNPTKDTSIPTKPIIKLVNFSSTKLLVLNDNEQIKFIDKSTNEETCLTQSIIKDLGGVVNNGGVFLAFSKSGNIKQIDQDLNSKELLNFKLPSGGVISNSMTAVEKFNDKVIIGDKYGGLYVQTDKVIFQTKAHSSSINEIIAFKFEEIEIICSIGRDRMIQFFQNSGEKYELVETVPIHQGNLLKVIHDKGKVYVCSSDRTISIHTLYKVENSIKINHDKVITLKATPITMRIYENELIVSQYDKTIQIYDISQDIEFVKSTRYVSKTNEFIQIESFIKYESYLIGWTSDKSLRMFDYNGGGELSVVWGHSDSIVGLFIHGSKLVSIGVDGCLFTWNLEESVKVNTGSSTPEMIIAKQVTRKILPRSPEKYPRIDGRSLLPPPKTISRRSSTPNLNRLTASASASSSTSTSPARLKSPLRTISPNKPVTTPVLKRPPHIALQTSQVEGILNKLDDITGKIPQLDSNEKKLVREKLVHIFDLINGPNHEDILEKYSDLLVDLVEKKLNLKS
ncbi:Mitogen-activated protein kinase-binding protein 1 [Spathaspora sp. JA1]|nr:Mitogen-activated protein kinase-binding protein 1 [Spathaspora sp. JA1]